MTYPQFVITHIDKSEKYGRVRELSSPNEVAYMQQYGLEFGGVAQIVYDVDGNIRGYCIPHEAIVDRVPQVGDKIIGIIARDKHSNLVPDAHGLPLLRQWFYAEQGDLFQDVDLSANPYASFEDYDEEESDSFLEPKEVEVPYGHADEDLAIISGDSDDDDYVDNPDDLAEIEHGRTHEMYNS